MLALTARIHQNIKLLDVSLSYFIDSIFFSCSLFFLSFLYEHVLNWDKISCRKIPLNIGSLFQNFIYTGNLSTLLQLLILNKAYYLEIKTRLITRNLSKFSRPCSHFGIIFEQEEKRGIPLYQTWHIVNSITLYHFTSHSIRELHIRDFWGIMVMSNSN